MASNSEHPSLPTGDAKVPVPTFGCVVYVSKLNDGNTLARVANLEGLSATASNERESLSRLVPLFKKFVKEKLEFGETIPWLDPPPAPNVDEQRRFLPVHL